MTKPPRDYLDPVSQDVNRLAEHFHPRDRWVFVLLNDGKKKFRVYSNQNTTGIRAVLKKYLKPRRKKKAAA